ncbi:hypothetical protein LA5095_04405 [Roseibium album]|uniref:Uncharacterized protein n=1 Tax=Roseibium album TaxID=311410 RepID=A0A0M6ZGC6_9HYPH|nr:hypothetical protein LA5094_04590 [Roseibium album]CTQ75276.1 hypothetical protein LA5096_04298 [Roseibium album]CTQ78581.1 hypothetical protein LA5095_04405 [Roseibium album]
MAAFGGTSKGDQQSTWVSIADEAAVGGNWIVTVGQG